MNSSRAQGYVEWLRGLVGPRKILLVTVTAFLQDEHGRVLFQRRSDFQDAWWGLPGGVLERGETAGQCVVREVEEETGLLVQPVRLTGVYTGPRYEVVYPNGDRVQQVTACFECHITGGDLRADGREIDSLVFYPPDQLPFIPIWYADMARRALARDSEAFFEQPHPRSLLSGQTPPEEGEPASRTNFLADMRRIVGHAALVMPGCSALVRDEDGRVLLQLRRDFEHWGLPSGAMDLGEIAAETVVRETREETGLEVEPIRLAEVRSGHEVVYPNGDRLFIFGMLFECRLVGGRLQPDGRESLEARFFDPEDLPPMGPGQTERLKQALSDTDRAARFL